MHTSYSSRHVNVSNGKFTYPDTQEDKGKVLIYLNTSVEVPTIDYPFGVGLKCPVCSAKDPAFK
jgi:hypothetical protein